MTFQTTPNIFWKLRSPTKSGPLSTDPPTTHSSPFLTIRPTQLATFHLKCSLHQIHQFSFTWVTRFTRITQFARITRIDKGRRKKKLVKSGQADRLGCPPPSPEAVRKMWKILDKLSYLGLFCHFIKDKMGQNFHKIEAVRLDGGDPPSPPQAVSLTAL